jgi:hypothetical protein
LQFQTSFSFFVVVGFFHGISLESVGAKFF